MKKTGYFQYFSAKNIEFRLPRGRAAHGRDNYKRGFLKLSLVAVVKVI